MNTDAWHCKMLWLATAGCEGNGLVSVTKGSTRRQVEWGRALRQRLASRGSTPQGRAGAESGSRPLRKEKTVQGWSWAAYGEKKDLVRDIRKHDPEALSSKTEFVLSYLTRTHSYQLRWSTNTEQWEGKNNSKRVIWNDAKVFFTFFSQLTCQVFVYLYLKWNTVIYLIFTPRLKSSSSFLSQHSLLNCLSHLGHPMQQGPPSN